MHGQGVTERRVDWPRRRRTGNGTAPVYGALDLGTNNCRLLIARPQHKNMAGRFRVIDAFSRIVRLGEGVGRNGELSEAGMQRTLAAVEVCAAKMRRRGVSRARCVATGACRQASNSEAFRARVAEATGLELEIISGREEARLAVAGVAQLFDPDHRYALIFDIGGATTELIWLSLAAGGTAVIDSVSLPCGVAALAEKYGDPAAAGARFADMVDEAAGMLQGFEAANGIGRTVRRARVQLLGTSGTTTTLAGIHLGLDRYDRARVDGTRLSRDDLSAVTGRLRRMPPRRLAGNGCVGPERANWVLPGAAILQAILDRWPCEALTVADRGVRDGILSEMMSDNEPRP